MNREDFIKQAEELSKPVINLVEKIIVKQNTAILEEMHDQLKIRDKKINQIEKTLITCIAWQIKEFGDSGVKQLLDMLDEG